MAQFCDYSDTIMSAKAGTKRANTSESSDKVSKKPKFDKSANGGKKSFDGNKGKDFKRKSTDSNGADGEDKETFLNGKSSSLPPLERDLGQHIVSHLRIPS